MKQIQSSDTVSVAAAIDLIETCLSLQLITRAELQDMNIQFDALSDPTLRLPESSLIRLWHILSQSEGENGIGLEIGRIINPNAKGLLASWISQTSSLREALTTFIENISLMNPSESWIMTEKDNLCTLSFDLRLDKGYPEIAIERSMCAIVTWGRALSGNVFSITETSFSFLKPIYEPLLTSTFCENIKYGADKNTLSFHVKQLNLPVVSSNAFLKEVVENKATTALQALNSALPLSDKITHIIHEFMLNDQSITVSKVSERLSISRQTLYRELKKYNTDFQSLLDAARKEKALYLLQSGRISIEVISLKLGYKDSSSFYKAFKRWYGQAPNTYLSSLS